MQAIFKAMIDFFFAPRCPACDLYVENHGEWCKDCLQKECRFRHLALDVDLARLVTGAYSVTYYRSGIKKLLHALKYQKRKSTLPYLAYVLKEATPLIEGLPEGVVATSVPLANERLKERGFNQTVELFRFWLASHNIPLIDYLVRTRNTTPLYELSAKERALELKGAFSLNEAITKDFSLAGRDILLLDDIMTTGATLLECVKVLRKAKVNSITILVLSSEHN